MSRLNAPFVSYNGGEVGKEVQGRTTLEGYGSTASTLENILPEGAGPMTFRRGLKFCVASPTPATYTHIEKFVYRLNQKYLLMFTDNQLRIVEDGGIVIRPSAVATIANTTFNGLANWDNYSAGSSTATGTGPSDRGLVLFCDGPNPSGVRQDVSTGSSGQPHGLDIVVGRGPVMLRVGSTSGGDEYIGQTELATGTHRLSFTPTGTFWVDFGCNVRREVFVYSASIAVGGDIVLTTPWDADDLRSLRFKQDLNVMFITDGVNRKYRLERRGGSSWSLVTSDEEDGPFQPGNIDETIRVAPSTRQGNGALTATKPLWSAQSVGQLWKITQNGQYEQRVANGEDQWSDAIRVTGVGTARDITWTVAGTYSGTVRLQRSVGNDSQWEDATGGAGTSSTTGTGSFPYNDGQDNVVMFYRVGIKTGQYTSGSATISIFFAGGASDGIARITSFVNPQLVGMEVLDPFASLAASYEWYEGSWSDLRGWPRAITTFDGRLWNGLAANFWGSVSESYESYREGDETADAVARSISVGDQAPNIVWMLSLGRLIVGCEGSEIVIRSNSLDDPLSTTSMTVREMSTYGSADVSPIKVDTRGIFVERSGSRAMELYYDAQVQDYTARPLTRMHRDIGRTGIRQLAVARQPESRLFMIRGDGQCLVKLFDPGENVLGWSRLVTDGFFESVAVLPGDDEDEVYFMIRRTVNGQAVRYLEQLDPMYIASASDHNGLDSYARYVSETPVTNIPNGTALHLAGKTVRVWADGAYRGTNIVTALGALTTPLTSSASTITVGLYYRGRYRSSKLAFGARAGTAMAQYGAAKTISLLLLDSVTSGIKYGAAFDDVNQPMDPVQTYLQGPVLYDSGPGLIDDTTDHFALGSAHTRDPRLCLEFDAPFPATIQGYVLGFHLDERVKA